VGSEQKYNRYGYKTSYEGDYDNADAELSAWGKGEVELSDERNEYLQSQWHQEDERARAAGSRNLQDRFQNATAELNYIEKNGFRGTAQEKADYISQLLRKQRQERKDAKDAGDQASAGGSTRTTSSRRGYDAKNNRGITGALELSAIPQDRAQELQNGRITLRGKAYNIVGNTGDKFLVPDPDQPDYSRRV
jgi:hypothetical protein